MIPIIALAVAVVATPDGELAYLTRTAPGPGHIHVISLDTRIVRAVGVGGALDRPRWSPDGRRLAYQIETQNGSAIYVADVDSGGGQQVAHSSNHAHGPAWSARGSLLAYTTGRGLDAQIAVFDLAADAETLWGGGRTSLCAPVWASSRLVRFLIDPDRESSPGLPTALLGERDTQEWIVAVGYSGAPGALTTDLVIVSEHDVTEIAETHLPSDGVYAEFAPAVSDDALAFESNDGGDREIFVISNRSTFDLSNHHAADWLPVWSPDAGTIAFQSFRDGRSGIYRCVPRRAGRVREVAAVADGDCWAPAWSPDGNWLAYVSDAEGESAVYIARVDGSERQRISPPGTSADLPSWRPLR